MLVSKTDDLNDPIISVLYDDDAETIEEIAERDELTRLLIERMQQVLTEREFDCIMMRFGISIEIEMTLKEIGEKMGVSREKARQLQDSALAKLKKHSKIKELNKAL